MKPTNEQLTWLGVDFDQTIADNTGFPDFKMTQPLDGAHDALTALVNEGYKIIVYTARGWSDHGEIREFMKKHELPYHEIVCGKLLAKYYIDDRNLAFDGDWKKITDTLCRTNKPAKK